ncbi:MAG: sugar phosphate isomerase/epimerase [Phycisphaera sp.]|nr:sugar phosphate isomerase/epimerase [Phycisphaera sp.]
MSDQPRTMIIPLERLGVCSWSLRPGSTRDLLDGITATGVPKVQLALDPVADRPESFGDSIEAIRAAGIIIASGMFEAVGEDYGTLDSIKATGGVRPDRHWSETRARAARAATMAADAGIPLVTMHAGFIPHEADDPARTVIIDRLREVADLFAARDIRLGLETGQETAETLVAALEALDHPAVGVNFDPANMILYGMGDPVAAIRTLAPYVVQVHAKDAVPTTEPGTWGAEVPLGRGVVEWEAFLAEVLTLRPEVDVVVEREAGEDRIKDIETARQLLAGA